MSNATDGLAAAVTRLIAAHSSRQHQSPFGFEPAAAVVDVGVLQYEMRASEGDEPRLALAKAVARQCLRIAPAKSTRAVEYARALQGDRNSQGTVDFFKRLHAAEQTASPRGASHSSAGVGLPALHKLPLQRPRGLATIAAAMLGYDK